MKRFLLIALILALAVGLMPTALADVVEITIPYYRIGENVGAKFFLPQVERFNQKYAGVYKFSMEEVPQDMYPEKIKQLGLQGMYPPLVEGCVDDAILMDDLVPNNKFYDLNQWLDKDPEFKALFIAENITYNTRDGKLFSVVCPVVRPTTLYYNGDLFVPSKPIGQMSWSELLAELGDNKIAFMTSENAWTTMIALTSMIAVQPGGAELLMNSVPEEKKIRDFNTPMMINAFTELKAALNYASSNTVGAAYADAANAFMSKNAAVICNGSWMVGDFAPDAADKWSNGFDGSTVHGDALPGNVGLDNVLGYGWWIPANTPADQAEAAFAFLRFIFSPEEIEAFLLAEGGASPNLALSADFLAKRAENRLLDEYVGAINKDSIIVPYFANCVPGSIADPELGKLLPKLIDGSFTPEQFCAELTKKASQLD